MFSGSSIAKTWTGPAKSRRVRPGNRHTASLRVGRVADSDILDALDRRVDCEVQFPITLSVFKGICALGGTQPSLGADLTRTHRGNVGVRSVEPHSHDSCSARALHSWVGKKGVAAGTPAICQGNCIGLTQLF